MHGRGIPGTADCLRPVFGKITSALAALLWEYLRRVFTAGLNIRLCSVSPLFAATPSFFQFSGHFDREIHDRLAHQSLPLWGRWHGVAVTEEGGTMFQNLPYLGAFLPLPPPTGAPSPKGRALRLTLPNDNFPFPETPLRLTFPFLHGIILGKNSGGSAYAFYSFSAVCHGNRGS